MTRTHYRALAWAVARAREFSDRYYQPDEDRRMYVHQLARARVALKRLNSETRVASLVKIITGG